MAKPKVIKWTVIYFLGTIIGFFAGANLLADYFDGGSEDFMALFYSALLGIVIAVIAVTLVKMLLSRKARN